MQNKLLKLALAAALVTGLSACGEEEKTQTQASQPEVSVKAVNHFNMNNDGEAPTLDPQKMEDSQSSAVARQIFEGLVNSNPDGKVVPGVATSWESNDDFTVWTFHLRDNAKWSNGDPVTAGDFVFAWQRLVDPATASPYSSYMDFLKVKNADKIIKGELDKSELGVKALDDHTFQVTLSSPVPYAPRVTLYASLYPVNPKVVAEYGDAWAKAENIVTNGAYKITNHVVNEKLDFARNEHYWDKDNVKIDTATFFALTDQTAAWRRYEAGELDIVNIPETVFKNFKKEQPKQTFVNDKLCVYNYEFNHNKPQFADIRVREALNLALDRTIITDKIMGQGQKPTYVYTHPSVGEGDLIKQPEYSKLPMKERNAKAIELLKEAGYSKENPLKFTLLYNTSEGHKKIAVAVDSMWKQNTDGLVEVKLENQEWKTFLDTKRKQEFDIARAAWCADYNQATTFGNYFLSDSSNNTTGYANAEYDKAITDSFSEKSEQGRAALYAKAESILAKDFALIPVYTYVSPKAVKPYIGGFTGKDPLGNLLIKDLSIKTAK